MKLSIKEVSRCRNGAFANFSCVSRENWLITVSLSKNRGLHEYAATLLHEMLHAWVTMLRLKGLRVTNAKEHRFIYAAEVVIANLARRYMRRRRI